jgi:uncharacterized protein (DUF2141 family)
MSNIAYTVSENSVSGYTQTSLVCTDDSTQDAVTNPVTLKEGQHVTCVITNTSQPATLTIVKEAYPTTAQSFDFTSVELGNFSLTGDNSANASKQFTSLSAGAYTISENKTDNWGTEYMYCSNEQDYSLGGDPLTVHLNVGDNVTCYVLNVEKNTISGHKFNDVNKNHEWDAGEPTLKNWTIKLTGCSATQLDRELEQACTPISLTTQTDASGAYSFTNLDPGTYTVCEVQQSKWEQTYPQGNNGCYDFTIEGPGQIEIADFGNHPIPQVLGETTELVNTGANASVNLLVGISLIAAAGALHLMRSRRQTNK